MSALFGVLGTLDQYHLGIMADQMAHRGQDSLLRHNPNYSGSVGYLWNKGSDKEQVHQTRGIYQQDSYIIALAGQIYHPGISLQELLNAYLKEGPGAIMNLEGGFVLTIQSPVKTFLCRDASGHRTIYYANANNKWLYASEPKAIHRLPGFPVSLCPASLAKYLTFSYVPGQSTMLESVYELPPGHYVELNHQFSKAKPVEYFLHLRKHPPVNETTNKNGKWQHQFQKLFTKAVTDRMPVSGSVGLFLSGGIDSSIVAAELAREYNSRVTSYSVHFGDEYPHELDYARQVATHCGLKHQEILIRPKSFLPNFRKMIWHLDEPIGDPVTMPNFELARLVSQYHRFIFNGEGGDPLFGGPKNIPMFLHHWYGGIKRDQNFRARKYLSSYRRAYEEISYLLTPEWQKKVDEANDLESMVMPYFNENHSPFFLDKLRMINIKQKGAHLILPKIERLTGAWQITPLSPLFDQQLIRFSFQMPPSLVLYNGVEKVILKQCYKNRLPESVINRPKSGMRVPVHFWFQGELKRYAKKILNPRKIRSDGIFNENRVKQLLDYATNERDSRYGLKLWMLISFETWKRLVIDGEPL